MDDELNQLGALMAGLYWGGIGGLIVLFSWFLWLSGYWSIHPVQINTLDGPRMALACPQCIKVSTSTYLLKDGSLKEVVAAGKKEGTPLRGINSALVQDFGKPESPLQPISGNDIKTPIFHVFQ
jgi:hypothetical protein